MNYNSALACDVKKAAHGGRSGCWPVLGREEAAAPKGQPLQHQQLPHLLPLKFHQEYLHKPKRFDL